MRKRQLTSTSYVDTPNGIPVTELKSLFEEYKFACQMRQDSQATQAQRALVIDKLSWYLDHNGLKFCGAAQLKGFIVHLTNGHLEPCGRFGNPRHKKALRPCSLHTYHKHLCAGFRYMTEEGHISCSPMDRIPAPKVRQDQVQPYSLDQIFQLMAAAKRSNNAKRDIALICLMLDTGLRASEVCGLKVGDLDFQGRSCVVLGKGNKFRKIYFGLETRRVLWDYLRTGKRTNDLDEPLFLSDRGTDAGRAMTRNGLFQLIQRLGEAANLRGVRCSPHTFRHTFAVSFLRRGGNTFTLKEFLGHTTLSMTNKYVALAEADLEQQHRMFSPVDGMKRSPK